MESTDRPLKGLEKSLDSHLWHACAGGMVHMPPVSSKVVFFPQGYAEHAHGKVEFGNCLKVPALILCRVSAIKYLADTETDEVYVKLTLVPVRGVESDLEDDGALENNGIENLQKPVSFAKTLTQSDANNGGGFSVPRYCAETIFPRLDYRAEPPVQTILAKDVHGETWKFRHIYRGTPRRHLLTTGWSNFVNRKKLVAGDSIVFLRAENGDLCIGIRRAKRGFGGGLESSCGWNSNPTAGSCISPFGGYSFLSIEDENNILPASSNCCSKESGKVMAESVLEAATLAASGCSFEVVYYPRASSPEFCVKASAVRAATQIQWSSGMRFKMAFETEDSSRISWFMGTISSVQVADPIQWPNSPWRLLQVTWDEPDLLQNVKRVSPWLVEVVSNMPALHLSSFPPPRKKLRLPQQADFSMQGQMPLPSFSSSPLRPSSPFCYTPANIQGARHAQFGLSSSNSLSNNSHSCPISILSQQGGFTVPLSRFPSNGYADNQNTNESVSCLLTMGNSTPNLKKDTNTKTPQFLLFGQPILTEEQISLSGSNDTGGNCSSEGSTERTANTSDSSAFMHHLMENSCNDRFPWYKDQQKPMLGLDSSYCQGFMESQDVARLFDLSVLGSYEELYRKLADVWHRKIKRC